MRPFAPLLLSLAATSAFAALPPLRAQQTPLPGPTFDERDIQVVRRGDKPPTNRGTKVALVVGIDRYKYLPKLDYADKDAKDVGAALQGLGFVVRTLRMDGEQPPANAISILSALDELCTAADPQDTIVVFLSGHGFSESGGKEGFFCAHFTDPERLTSTGLSLDEVRRRLVASKAKQRMLVVDACRNVPGARTVGAKLEIGEAFRAEGLGVLFSTSPGTQSLEPRGIDQDAQGRTIQNGIFTHYLLRGLEGDADHNGDGWLTFRELAYHTWSEVKAKTQLKQKPYLDWVGEAGGDFLLRQVPVRAVAAPSTPEVRPSPTPVVPVPAPAAAGPQPPSGCKVAAGAKVVDGVWDRIEHEASGIVLRYVPPGEFMMGSPANEEGRSDDETQHRRVIEKGFYLGETEVTVGQWRRFAQASGYRTDAERGVKVGDNRVGAYTVKPDGGYEWHADASWENPFPLLRDYRLEEQHPVVQVSWNDASKFCQHHGLMLPSEAQWEWACRSRTKTRFPWGAGEEGGERFANVADQSAKRRFSSWTTFGFDDGHALLAKVGSYEANRYGLKDMIGNVREWCADGYQSDYPGDGATEAPAGAGASRVLRGGSWYVGPAGCRAARRDISEPALRSGGLGFRAARTL